MEIKKISRRTIGYGSANETNEVEASFCRWQRSDLITLLGFLFILKEFIMTSNKQSDIWHLLKQKGAQTPTQIGVALGKNYGRASSWACGGLKVLVRTGFVKRLDGGSYEAI